MNENEILRRLCKGALTRILNEHNVATNSNAGGGNAILNTILANAFGTFILRKVDKGTQTDNYLLQQQPQYHHVQVGAIKKGGKGSTQGHLWPLVRVPEPPRKNCIR